MPRRKSKQELDAELAARRIDRSARVIDALIRYGAFAVIAYYVYKSIDALAGRTTLADVGIGVRILGEAKISEALAWILACSFGWYGARQRRLRRDVIQELGNRVKHFEEERDPKRSSSYLSPRGTTRPEDLP